MCIPLYTVFLVVTVEKSSSNLSVLYGGGALSLGRGVGFRFLCLAVKLVVEANEGMCWSVVLFRRSCRVCVFIKADDKIQTRGSLA